MHSIRFSGFYHGFAPEDSLFWRVATSLGYSFDVVTSTKHPVDIEVHGPYVQHLDRLKGFFSATLLRLGLPGGRDSREIRIRSSPENPKCIMIFESAENVRVPMVSWDLSMSFDLDSYHGTNFYTPYWWFSTDLFQSPMVDRVGRRISVEELLKPRKSGRFPEKFCATVIRNPEPVRMRAIEALSRVGAVDIFGPHSGRPLTSKTEIEGQYRFIMAFENDLFPGYVTEKPIEAWAMGSVPLWYGLDEASSLNPDALINAADYPSLSDFARVVATLEENPVLWEQHYVRPFLNSAPNPEHLVTAIHDLLNAK